MDAISLADGLYCLALGIALAACAGIRAWLPLLLAGLMSRAGLLHLGESLRFLGSNKALALFAVATLLELLGDKVPALDHALDALGTFLRPAAGSLLAASVMWSVSDPLAALALGVAVGAPTAMLPHAAKTLLRAASSTFTAGLANPVLSLLEDVLTLILFALAVVVPVLVVAAVAGLAWLALRRRRPAVVSPA
jgi:Domain of unknown function (DUF4126)